MMKNRKNQIWESYQKEIAGDHYYFARSCIRQNFFPAAEGVFLKILRDELDIDICDDARQTTCTGIAYHSGLIPFETIMTVIARQFSLMNDAGYGIPVLTYEELAGLLLGYDPWDIGLQTHQVAVEPLLQKLGIEYDPERKYTGLNNENLGWPEIPETLRCH